MSNTVDEVKTVWEIETGKIPASVMKRYQGERRSLTRKDTKGKVFAKPPFTRNQRRRYMRRIRAQRSRRVDDIWETEDDRRDIFDLLYLFEDEEVITEKICSIYTFAKDIVKSIPDDNSADFDYLVILNFVDLRYLFECEEILEQRATLIQIEDERRKAIAALILFTAASHIWGAPGRLFPPSRVPFYHCPLALKVDYNPQLPSYLKPYWYKGRWCVPSPESMIEYNSGLEESF